MATILPTPKDVWVHTKGFFSSIGIGGTVIVIAVALGVGLLLWDSASNALHAYESDKKVAAEEKRADEADKRADESAKQAEQYKGAAAAYAQQSAEQQKQVTELLNARPDLQARSAASGRAVEAIRNQRPVPVDANIRQRIADVSADLDKLYPDK